MTDPATPDLITVAVVGGTDLIENPRRPDLPPRTSYTVVADHGDTMSVRLLN